MQAGFFVKKGGCLDNMMISKRLKTIADYVPPGSRLADIGSDHALLPVFLLTRQICTFAIAGEVVDGPLQAAKQQIARAGLSKQIEARKGDGLAVIAGEEIDVVTIAGMGGSLIRSILENGNHLLCGVRMLVLQPNVGEETVRQWLHEHDWYLTDETILEEDGRIYEILVAERLDGARTESERLYAGNRLALNAGANEWNFRMGPWLLWRAEPLLSKKWQAELQKWQTVYRQLEQSQSAEAALRRAEVGQQMRELEEILRVCKRTNGNPMDGAVGAKIACISR